MIHIIDRSLRILLLGIVPLILLVSGSDTEGERLVLKEGTCQFKILGKTNLDLTGVAMFKSISENEGRDILRNMLELTFEFNSETSKELIRFMVPQKLGQQNVEVGKYRIKSVKGLLNDVEGTYGFTDLGTQSELPYFVNRGAINILKSDDNGLVGSVEMEFRNTEKEILHVEGFFNAK